MKQPWYVSHAETITQNVLGQLLAIVILWVYSIPFWTTGWKLQLTFFVVAYARGYGVRRFFESLKTKKPHRIETQPEQRRTHMNAIPTTKEALKQAFLLWSKLEKEGKTKTRAELEATPQDEVASECAEHLWNLLKDQIRDQQPFEPVLLQNRVKVVGDHLVLCLSFDTIAAAALGSDYFGSFEAEGNPIKVADKEAFARAVASSLNMEEEDGSTKVTRMLDRAFKYVVEQGDDSIGDS